jgi:cystinosin
MFLRSRSTVCWSASFYPQPINNYRRRSTYGLAIDFPTINVLGFVCYTIYALGFLYSPLIRKQYAARNPSSPEPSVQLNDLAFAVHAVILSSLIYSQFFPFIWGFKVAPYQRVSKPVAGLFWGSLIAIALLVFYVLGKSPDGGADPFSWAWIDIVRSRSQDFILLTEVVKLIY